MTAERAFPAHCPKCNSLLATTGDKHCDSHSCPWVTCGQCKHVIAEDGRHIPGVGAGAA